MKDSNAFRACTWPVWLSNLVTSVYVRVCARVCECLLPTEGEVSQDMRYPICPIRHLFLNRPHLHNLPRSIHKNTNGKRTASEKSRRAPLVVAWWALKYRIAARVIVFDYGVLRAVAKCG